MLGKVIINQRAKLKKKRRACKPRLRATKGGNAIGCRMCALGESMLNGSCVVALPPKMESLTGRECRTFFYVLLAVCREVAYEENNCKTARWLTLCRTSVDEGSGIWRPRAVVV